MNTVINASSLPQVIDSGFDSAHLATSLTASHLILFALVACVLGLWAIQSDRRARSPRQTRASRRLENLDLQTQPQ